MEHQQGHVRSVCFKTSKKNMQLVFIEVKTFKLVPTVFTESGFKVNEFSSRMPDPYEMEGLKNSAAHVAGLLKNEPENGNLNYQI